jgi:hypothetical protein
MKQAFRYRTEAGVRVAQVPSALAPSDVSDTLCSLSGLKAM